MARDMVMGSGDLDVDLPDDEAMSTDPFEDRLKRAVPPATVSVPVFGYRRDGTQPGGPAGGKRREAAGQPGATALRDLPVMLPARREPQRVWDTLAAIRWRRSRTR
jgi:hypothetical protein